MLEHSTLSGLQWVTNGYLLALAVLLIPGGKLGDRLGRRLVFSVGITGFALASLGCALSSSIGMLVCFRVLQGVSGAMLMPNTLAILRATFPQEKLTQAVGIWGATTALAVASGPIVGGLLVQRGTAVDPGTPRWPDTTTGRARRPAMPQAWRSRHTSG